MLWLCPGTSLINKLRMHLSHLCEKQSNNAYLTCVNFMLHNEGMDGPQLVDSTLRDLAAAAIDTVSVTSNQTQSLSIQLSSCTSA